MGLIRKILGLREKLPARSSHPISGATPEPERGPAQTITPEGPKDHELRLFDKRIVSLSAAAAVPRLVIAGEDEKQELWDSNKIKVLDLEQGRVVLEHHCGLTADFCMDVSSDGSTIVQTEQFLSHKFGPGDRDFALFKPSNGARPIYLAILPGDQRFVVGDEFGAVTVWDLASLTERASRAYEGEIPTTFDPHYDEVEYGSTRVGGLGASSAADVFASVDINHVLRIWSPSMEEIACYNDFFAGENLSVSADGYTVAGISYTDIAVLFRGEITWLRGDKAITSHLLMPNGRTLVAGHGTQLSVWDLSTATKVGSVDSGSRSSALAYLPTMSLIASGHVDGVVRFWSLDGNKSLAPGYVRSLAEEQDYSESVKNSWNVDASLMHAAELLLQRDLYQFESWPVDRYAADLRLEELTGSMLELERIANEYGAKPAFWRRIQPVAHALDMAEKADEFEQRFHAELAAKAKK